MFPLNELLDVKLLIRDKKSYKTANIFGFIAYSERDPYIVKVLRDVDFWQSLNSRTDGWILYAIQPDSKYYGGGNAKFVNDSLGLNPEECPQLVILSIGSNGIMKQRGYLINADSVDTTYKAIEKNINIISSVVKDILPEYKTSTNVNREAIKALDAELASESWKRVSKSLKSFVVSLLRGLL